MGVNRQSKAASAPRPAGLGIASATRHVVDAIFARPLRIERRAGGIKVLLGGAADEVDRPVPARRVDDHEGRAMRTAVATLLDAAPRSREVLRHLALVEKALQVGGVSALNQLPHRVLVLAMRQFDGLLAPPMPAGSMALRRQLLDLIQQRKQAALETAMDDPLAAFLDDEKLQVGEATLDEFDSATQSFHGFAAATR